VVAVEGTGSVWQHLTGAAAACGKSVVWCNKVVPIQAREELVSIHVCNMCAQLALALHKTLMPYPCGSDEYGQH
jgi:hypothetical protein